MSTVNERIKELRKRLGTEKNRMTLEKFGAAIGISAQAVSGIERGENNPSEQTIKMICRVFNVSEEWIREGTGEPFVKLDREEELMAALGKVMASEPDSFRRRWMAVFAQLTEAEWDTLESIFFRLFDAKKED